jgi:transcriptional regulator with XRE-family HTH domain
MTKTLGARKLDAAAAEIGCTALAERLGVTASLVSHLRVGRRLPGRELAVRIEAELRIPVADWGRP